MTRLLSRPCGCRGDRPCAPSCARAPVDPRSRPSASVVAEIEAMLRATPTSVQQRKRRVCDVPGCGRRHMGKGYCARHYNLAKRLGDAAARLVPSSRVRKCSACENPIGTANVSGVCRPCRVYAKRSANPLNPTGDPR